LLISWGGSLFPFKCRSSKWKAFFWGLNPKYDSVGRKQSTVTTQKQIRCINKNNYTPNNNRGKKAAKVM
jgi:hypothetical protein